MKGRLAAAVAAVVLIGAGVAVAVGSGLRDDAMVSKSYYEDTYLPALRDDLGKQAEKSAAAVYDKAAKKLDDLGEGHLKAAKSASPASAGYTVEKGAAGDSLKLSEGAGVLLYSGGAKLSSGALSDVTTGNSVAAGSPLRSAHRYIVTSASGAALELTEASSLGWQGEGELRRGTGSSDVSTPGSDPSLPFKDVPKSQWYYDSVTFVYEKGYFAGTGSDTFSPNASMDRAMVATVLYRLSGSSRTSRGAGFADVPSGQWYSDAVAWASANGVVNGMGDGTYAPTAPVTREQLITMLYRYEKDYRKAPVPGTGDLSPYPDSGKVSAWSRDAMSWAVGAGLIQGRSSGHLDPAGTATRAEVAAILQRFSQRG